MQFEFGKALRGQGDETGVVRARADFGEPHLIAFDKKLDTKQTAATEAPGDGLGDGARLLQSGFAHRLRLPGFNIVTVDLQMPDRLAKVRLHVAAGSDGAYGEQGDFVVEVDEAFDNDAALADAPALHRVVPCLGYIIRATQQGLPFAGGRHRRLDQAGVTDSAINSRLQAGQRIGKGVRGGWQAEFLGHQPADTFTVHRQARGARRRNDFGQPFAFDFEQHVGGNRFDFRHHQVRALLLDQGAQRLAVGHRHHVRTVGDLHSRRVGVAIHGNCLDAEPLQSNDYFLAEFSGAEQHDARCRRAERRTKRFEV